MEKEYERDDLDEDAEWEEEQLRKTGVMKGKGKSKSKAKTKGSEEAGSTGLFGLVRFPFLLKLIFFLLLVRFNSHSMLRTSSPVLS